MLRYTKKTNVETKPTKYTRDFVIGELKEFLGRVKGDKEIIYIKQLMAEKDYTYERFSEWRRKFSEDELNDAEITHTIKKIHNILESRQFIGGLTGGHNPAVAIFGLKNNYGWKDKQEIDHTSKGDKIYSWGPYEEKMTKKPKVETYGKSNSVQTKKMD